MNNNLVSIGIVTWNSASTLNICLDSLSFQESVDFDLVIIDNASKDESLNIAKNHFPNAKFVKNKFNTGFCHAHNQGIRLSQGEFYLPLNPDITLMPGYIAYLVELLRKSPEYGMAGGKLLLKDDIQKKALIDSCGLFIDRKRRQYLRGYGQEDRGQFDQPQEVFGIDGAAPLYRRQMLEDVCIDGQYFDEAFFAHKEDVDLAWRSRLLGWKAAYNPKAVAYHVRSFRPGTRDRVKSDTRLHAVKNRYYLLLKNEAKGTWKRDWAHILLYDLMIWGYILLKERSSFKAISYLKKDWPHLKEWRNEIWKRVKVQDSEIQGWFIDNLTVNRE